MKPTPPATIPNNLIPFRPRAQPSPPKPPGPDLLEEAMTFRQRLEEALANAEKLEAWPADYTLAADEWPK